MKRRAILIFILSVIILATAMTRSDAETFTVNSMVFGGYPPGAVMSFGGGSFATYYTWYDLNTDRFGTLQGFCIEGDVYAPTGSALPTIYELIGIDPSDNRMKQAAWVADNYLPSNRTLAQIVIWNLLEDSDYSLSSGSVKYTGDLLGSANTILSSLGSSSSFSGPGGWAIARSAGYQDYLVKNPVPEPTSMFLFGAGLIIMTGFARRRIKNSKKTEVSDLD